MTNEIFSGTFTEWHKYLSNQLKKDRKKIEKLDKIRNIFKMQSNEIIHRLR